ncbi:NUDIX hydrolase [Tetragenococcus osmophilus]|uniref:NUDIX hydrolase n=1 Tax=Tetragenococcus osmophilus TaxID=526944 RepID=A0ABN5QXY9_9ENTE|nr:NUDIX domain-containing protein [Tetragenococcus osmophilus]AYW48020.1 NUDIX hydrolase [Tetragenococcus osmophilus]
MEFASKQEEQDYYQHVASEQEFLEWYKKQEHPIYQNPSVTVDMVLLCYNKSTDQIKVLLIQRRGNPYRNSWALPGGFITASESTGDSVIRETKEETGVTISAKNIEQLHTFSTPGRDPRGWVITVSYLAFIGEAILSAGDNANQARWFTLERKDNQLYLTSGEIEIILDLQTQKSLGKDDLAFDHNQIIIKAFNRIANKMAHEPQVLQVLGETFTITEARKVFAKFLGVDYRSIDHSNFKKSLLDFLEEVGERPAGVGRPSKLYRLKEDFREN